MFFTITKSIIQYTFQLYFENNQKKVKKNVAI